MTAEDKTHHEAEVPEVEESEENPNFDKKHILENKWTLWFDNPQQKQTTTKFGQTLRPVLTFDNVEDFWSLYNNIKTPGQLVPSATFYLFKEGIDPKWEDPRNINGGSWTAPVPSIQRSENSKATLDAWWLNAVLACIGEQFTEGDEVCGVAVNIRAKGDRIELWTRTAANEAKQISVGKELRKFLDVPESMKLGYSVFQDILSSKTSRGKDRYSV